MDNPVNPIAILITFAVIGCVLVACIFTATSTDPFIVCASFGGIALIGITLLRRML